MSKRSNQELRSVSVMMPVKASERIDEWVKASGLTQVQFHSIALVTGGRVMTSSVGFGFGDSLSPEERAHVSGAANATVTPAALLEIVFRDEATPSTNDSKPSMTQFAVSLPASMAVQFEATADGMGMDRDKFYALSLALGARILAETLEENTVFPLGYIMQAMEGPMVPEAVMRAVARHTTPPRSKKPPGTKKGS